MHFTASPHPHSPLLTPYNASYETFVDAVSSQPLASPMYAVASGAEQGEWQRFIAPDNARSLWLTLARGLWSVRQRKKIAKSGTCIDGVPVIPSQVRQ